MLVVVLFASLLALTAAALVLGAYAHDVRLLAHREDDLRLTALADAGVARALAELATSREWSGTATPIELDRGRVDVEVTRTGDPLRRSLRVEAVYRGAARAVAAEVLLTPSGPRVVAWRPVGSGVVTAP